MTVGPSTRATQEASGLLTPPRTGAKAAAVAVAAGYYNETGPQTTKIWVDGLTVIGPMTYVLGAYNNQQGGGSGGTIYYRNVTAPDGMPQVTASPMPDRPRPARSNPIEPRFAAKPGASPRIGRATGGRP